MFNTRSTTGPTILEQAWTNITMDFVEKLLVSHTFDTILVVIDHFTKYGHFLSLKHPFTTSLVAQLFLDHIYKLYGLPVSIVIDRDKLFTSHFLQEIFKLIGVSLHLNSSYHPKTNGQSEKLN